jgi:hypothetical protein
MDKLIWCLRYQHADFSKYIFADETTLRLCDVPIYQWRKASSYPDAYPCSEKYAAKLNVWSGISFRGATQFAVHIDIIF